MNSISPVYNHELVIAERVVALDQPEYIPLIALPVQITKEQRYILTRWEFTDKEREIIADGGHLIIGELLFNNQAFTPLAMQVIKPDATPSEISVELL